MYIFYDFETSDKDFLGQILSYYFVLVDATFTPINELSGFIKPNRTECPKVGAIQVNKLSIETCINDGLSEFEAANTIYQFLQTTTNDYGAVPLVGFNSARFDFKHLEKLLLKHGLSPTFYGKISSLDVYQFAKFCALSFPKDFPFVPKKQHNTYSFSFKLEDLAQAFDCLKTPQTHDAKDDVILTIELTKTLEKTFDTSLKEFQSTQHNTSLFFEQNHFLKEPYFPFEQKSITPIVNYNEWLVIGQASKTTFILLDLNAYNNHEKTAFNDYSSFTRYFNTRANALVASKHPFDDNNTILSDPNIQKIRENALQYFKLFPVDWDIEYRPWAMGFDNIPLLRRFIETLSKDPNSYKQLINEWKEIKKSKPEKSLELNFMIQLFNRFYLNHHPSPELDHMQKYISPRYKTGKLFRNPTDFVTVETELNTLDFYLTNTQSTTEKTILNELKNYIKTFKSAYL